MKCLALTLLSVVTVASMHPPCGVQPAGDHATERTCALAICVSVDLTSAATAHTSCELLSGCAGTPSTCRGETSGTGDEAAAYALGPSSWPGFKITTVLAAATAM